MNTGTVLQYYIIVCLVLNLELLLTGQLGRVGHHVLDIYIYI